MAVEASVASKANSVWRSDTAILVYIAALTVIVHWITGQQYGFQVLDPPQLPTVATPQTKKIMIYPLAAAVAGLGLMGLLLVLLVASDRSVRSEMDLALLWPKQSRLC